MSMTDAKVNFNFEENILSYDHIPVTNNLGRTVEHLEIVALDGYFGEMTEFDDVADGAVGTVNINSKREIRTTQINVSDTFVVGGIVYFKSGGSAAAGELRAGYVEGAVPVGKCTYADSGTSIGFKPFAQDAGGPDVIKATTYAIDADAHTAPIDITGIIPVGAKIVDVMVECTAAVTSGTVTLKSNAASPAVITSAIVCAVDNAVARTTSLANNVVDGDGLQVLTHATGDRGLMTIYWR